MDAPTRWHVSPSVDLIGYGFGWLILAVPMYLLLSPYPLQIRDPRLAAFWFLAIATVMLDVHRHFTFPYVYLDRRVRTRFPVRFWLLPAIFAGLFTQMPFWNGSARSLGVPSACAIVAWALLVAQLLIEDGMGEARRARAVRLSAAAGVSAAVLTVAFTVVPVASSAIGFTWLLAAAGTSVGLTLGSRADGAPAGVVEMLVPGALGATVGTALLAEGTVTVGSIVNVGIGIYVVWLLYHGTMQKYGIMRIYSAKSGCASKVPGWVDGWLVWSWIPMVIVWTAGSAPATALSYLDGMSSGTGRLIGPILALADSSLPLLLAIAGAGIASSLGAFLYFEWKLHRLRNAPRLLYGLGTHLFHACVFVLGPVGWYVVGATMHGIEYITFVWAFQRRRFPTTDAQAPVLSRLVAHPFLYYVVGSAVMASVIFCARFARIYFGLSEESITFFGARLTTWAIWYSLLHAIPHFYYDGFLWKMRHTELSKSL